MSDAFGKLARRRRWLSEIVFDIVHLAGINHQATDAISRIPTARINYTKADNKFQVLTRTTDMFNTDKTEQEKEACEDY